MFECEYCWKTFEYTSNLRKHHLTCFEEEKPKIKKDALREYEIILEKLVNSSSTFDISAWLYTNTTKILNVEENLYLSLVKNERGEKRWVTVTVYKGTKNLKVKNYSEIDKLKIDLSKKYDITLYWN